MEGTQGNGTELPVDDNLDVPVAALQAAPVNLVAAAVERVPTTLAATTAPNLAVPAIVPTLPVVVAPAMAPVAAPVVGPLVGPAMVPLGPVLPWGGFDIDSALQGSHPPTRSDMRYKIWGKL